MAIRCSTPSSSRTQTASWYTSCRVTVTPPLPVLSVTPSGGSRVALSRYCDSSYARQHIRRPQAPEILDGLNDSCCSRAILGVAGWKLLSQVEQQNARPHG